MKLQNSNILITGGASGIGKIMGRMALEKGAKCFIICSSETGALKEKRLSAVFHLDSTSSDSGSSSCQLAFLTSSSEKLSVSTTQWITSQEEKMRNTQSILYF